MSLRRMTPCVKKPSNPTAPAKPKAPATFKVVQTRISASPNLHFSFLLKFLNAPAIDFRNVDCAVGCDGDPVRHFEFAGFDPRYAPGRQLFSIDRKFQNLVADSVSDENFVG